MAGWQLDGWQCSHGSVCCCIDSDLKNPRRLLTLKGFTADSDSFAGIELACNVAGITSTPELLLFSLVDGNDVVKVETNRRDTRNIENDKPCYHIRFLHTVHQVVSLWRASLLCNISVESCLCVDC